jgi:hypothetical protein
VQAESDANNQSVPEAVFVIGRSGPYLATGIPHALAPQTAIESELDILNMVASAPAQLERVFTYPDVDDPQLEIGSVHSV